MKKFFAVILILLCMSFSVSADEVEQDTELHRVIGGLYTLAAAVNLNRSVNPSITQISRYFSSVPDEWQITTGLTREKNALWVGVPVGKYSTARHFLRSHSKELGILDSPGGYAWLGGDYAWLKAADISGNTLKPIELHASRGAGIDSGIIFFSVPEMPQWWQADPSFGPNSAKMITDTFGIKNAPELHKPEGVSKNVYDTMKHSSVRVPEKMHVGTQKSSFDMSIEMGDVIFNPIPNTRR